MKVLLFLFIFQSLWATDSLVSCTDCTQDLIDIQTIEFIQYFPPPHCRPISYRCNFYHDCCSLQCSDSGHCQEESTSLKDIGEQCQRSENCKNNFCFEGFCKGRIGDTCQFNKDCGTERCYKKRCIGNSALKRFADTGFYCHPLAGDQCFSGYCDGKSSSCISDKRKASTWQACQNDLQCKSQYCHPRFNICLGTHLHLAKPGDICLTPLECSSRTCSRTSDQVWGVCQ